MRVAALLAKQQEDHDELIAMIKALERQKQNRSPLTFVKTGVSASSPPQFLINKDIIAEQKRTYQPTPLTLLRADMDQQSKYPLHAASPASSVRKRKLKKTQHFKKIKQQSQQEKQLLQEKQFLQEKQALPDNQPLQEKRLRQEKQPEPAQRAALYSEKSAGGPKRRYHHTGVWRWLEELAIIMSKMSLLGLFLVLSLLGSVFFGVGFLAALSNVQDKAEHPLWHQATAPAAANSSFKNSILRTAGSVASTIVDQKAAMLESKIGGNVVNTAVQKVPMSLQPFALEMQNKFTQQAQAVVIGGSRALQGTFNPSSLNALPPPPAPNQVAYQAPLPTNNMVMQNRGGYGTANTPPYRPMPVNRKQYTPSQQAFRQAGQLARQQPLPPSVPQQYRGNPNSPYPQQGYPAAVAMPPSFPPQQPPVAAGMPIPQGGYAQQMPGPAYSQPYGASQPYGYSQGMNEPPRMIGMG